jgi:signal transduction histidine kinase
VINPSRVTLRNTTRWRRVLIVTLRSVPFWRRVLIVVAAGLVGVVLNSFPVMLVGGVFMAIGQALALASAIVMGPVAGVVSAGIAAGPLLKFGQPTTWLLFVLEALIVGFLSRRRRPIVSDLVYWTLVGGPIILIVYAGVRSMPTATVALILVKNVLGGAFNTVLATLISEAPPFENVRRLKKFDRRSLDALLAGRLSIVVLLPVLLTLLGFSEAAQRSEMRSARDRLRLEASRSASAVREFVRARIRVTETTAAQLVASRSQGVGVAQDFLTLVLRTNPGFISLLITDSIGQVVAASIRGGGAARATSVADRPYYANAMRTGKPFVSGVFRGRMLGSDTIAAISAPLLRRGATAAGIVEGSIDLKDFDGLLLASPGVHITVIDQNGRVLYTSAPANWPILSQVPNDAVMRDNAEGTHWRTEARLLTSEREMLYSVSAAGNGWFVVADTPRSSALHRASIAGTTLFVLSVTLMVLSLLAVRRVSRNLGRPLRDLEERLKKFDWTMPTAETAIFDAHLHSPREVATVADALGNASQRIREEFDETRRVIGERDVALRDRDRMLHNLDAVVSERTHELAAERDRAESASRAKSAFLANMSHELRSPLNIILGEMEIMTEGLRGPITPEQLDSLGETERQGQHLLRLVNEILDLARIESGHIVIQLQDVDIAALLDDVVSSFGVKVDEKRIQLSLVGADGPAVVTGDDLRLRQIAINLIDNAVKFTPDGGRVNVTLHRAEGDARLLAVSVHDSGIGIPRDSLGRIFDAFEQVDTSTTRSYGGTGLGLTLSRRMAEGMGMQIEAESEPGEGSTFWLRLPDRATIPTDALDKS